MVRMLDRCQDGARQPYFHHESVGIKSARVIDGDLHHIEAFGLQRLCCPEDARVLHSRHDDPVPVRAACASHADDGKGH